jgi:hypothetical protein
MPSLASQRPFHCLRHHHLLCLFPLCSAWLCRSPLKTAARSYRAAATSSHASHHRSHVGSTASRQPSPQASTPPTPAVRALAIDPTPRAQADPTDTSLSYARPPQCSTTPPGTLPAIERLPHHSSLSAAPRRGQPAMVSPLLHQCPNQVLHPSGLFYHCSPRP